MTALGDHTINKKLSEEIFNRTGSLIPNGSGIDLYYHFITNAELSTVSTNKAFTFILSFFQNDSSLVHSRHPSLTGWIFGR